MVATTVYETENIVAVTISLPVKMLVAQTLTSGWGWGCRCEANTNVPGAPRILDPPLLLSKCMTLVRNIVKQPFKEQNGLMILGCYYNSGQNCWGSFEVLYILYCIVL